MKVRLGFVSNSSSSSFLIYGICENEKTLVERALKSEDFIQRAFKFFHNSWEKWGKERGRTEPMIDDIENLVSDGIYEIMEGFGLECHCPYDSGYYIGHSWGSVNNDETGKQFKERTEKELTELFGEGLNFSTLSCAWYNG